MRVGEDGEEGEEGVARLVGLGLDVATFVGALAVEDARRDAGYGSVDVEEGGWGGEVGAEGLEGLAGRLPTSGEDVDPKEASEISSVRNRGKRRRRT